ncbi:MAG: response regulator [Acidobacteriota bacterium]|nr:response regulator [Acidobacteriota bacterium]
MKQKDLPVIPLVTPLDPLPDRRLVMVVDDEAPLLSLDEKILSRENYELIFAASGEDALEQIATLDRAPDLLITDYMMPGITGRELAARVRERNPDLKVLYQTGYADRLFGPLEILEPGSSFLEKPFTSRGMREAARLALFGVINPAALTA